MNQIQAALDVFDARPRYKALGNSWAVNCAGWIGERIEAVEAILGAQPNQQERRAA